MNYIDLKDKSEADLVGMLKEKKGGRRPSSARNNRNRGE